MAKAHTFKPYMVAHMGRLTRWLTTEISWINTHGWQNGMRTYKLRLSLRALLLCIRVNNLLFRALNVFASGAASNAPAIKNYPVQGLAGGCIMPLALIRLQSAFSKKGIKSLIINTVHDSVVIDVYPGEDMHQARSRLCRM